VNSEVRFELFISQACFFLLTLCCLLQVTKDIIKDVAKNKWKALNAEAHQDWDLKYRSAVA